MVMARLKGKDEKKIPKRKTRGKKRWQRRMKIECHGR